MAHRREAQHRTDHTAVEGSTSATQPAAPELVRISLLGGFGMSVGSRTIEESGRLRKAEDLIKLLTLAPGHSLHRERVVDALWPDLGTQQAATTSTTPSTVPAPSSRPSRRTAPPTT